MTVNRAKKLILHLCADIGSDSQPYREDDAYEVICVGKDIGVENYHPPKKVHGIIANPPCTEFSRARAGGKSGNVEIGLKLVRECQRIIAECWPNFYVIENPATGALKQEWIEPDYAYEPWWFGSPWTKRTALWGKFNIPKRTYYRWEDVPKIEGLYTRPGREKPSIAFMHKNHKRFISEFDCFEVKDDMSFRSLCSQKFAQAFKEANP